MGKKRRMVLIASLVMGMTAGSVAATTLAGCKPKVEVPADDVTGVYYGEANGKECEVELFGSSMTFSLTVDGDKKEGEYSYDGTNLNLRFSDNTTIVANLTKSGAENKYVLTIEYNGTTFVLNEGAAVKYTVSFKYGDEVLKTVTVVEGKKVNKIDAPTKTGFTFIGWYEDAEFKIPFDFANKTISGATTVYARYVQVDASKNVFDVKFDAGEGVTAPSSVQTVNGVVYNLPTVSKSGATFAGWWVSDYNDADKLTYKYEGQELKQNTTLFAVWESNAPMVSVTSTGIRWTLKGSGSNSCEVEITLPDGTKDNLGFIAQTSVDYDFSAPGEYVISVTRNGQTTKVYLNNKGLARVSAFEVEGNVLKFTGVDNAEKYLITVVCGDGDHVVTDYDLGSSTQYDFSRCTMTKDGIKFIVKARATGYVDSVSEEYTFKRGLDAVANLSAANTTDIVTWDAVSNASYYVVKITQDGKTKEERINTTSYNLEAYAAGAIKIEVYAVAAGYYSPDATAIDYTKVKLAVPQNLTNDGLQVSWTAVPNAKGYIIKVGDTVVGEVDGTSYTLTDAQFVNGIASVTVSAKGNYDHENSNFSTALTINKRLFSAPPTYLNGKLNWGTVLDAAYYEVKVNNGDPVKVEGATSSKVDLTKAGNNEVSVRCAYKDGGYSDWNSTTVFAYTVTLDLNNGDDVIKVFKAANDDFDLQDVARTGYTFTGWIYSETGMAFDAVKYPATDLELTAVYKANKYTLTLKLDDGEVFATKEVTFGEKFNLSVPESSNPMKTFGGWRLELNGQGTQYTDPLGIGSREWNIASNTNLYASWLDVFKFTLSQNGDEYSVSGGAGMRFVTTIKIPAYYEGLPITTVASGAFQGCSYLKSVQIPNSIRIVAMGTEGGNAAGSAFYGCTSLEAVEVYAVEGFNASAALYTSVDGVLIFNNERTGEVEIGYYPYDREGEYVIPDSVTVIPTGVFRSTKITKVTIPASVKSIDSRAFYMCSKLQEVTFLPTPAGKTEVSLNIAKESFASCSLLETINFPKRLYDLDMEAFSTYASKLTEVHVEAGGIFSDDDGVLIKEIDGVKTVYYCPRGREKAYLISSPDIKVIGKEAFKNCKITEIVIPEWIERIENDAFRSCTSVTKLTFKGDKLSEDLYIAEGAFYSCTGLTDLVLSANITVIEQNAFGGISTLKEVTISCSRDKAVYSNNAFASESGKTYVTTVNLGADVPEMEVNGIFGGLTLEKVNVDPANPNYAAEDGVLYNNDFTKIIFYPSGREGNFIIKDTVQVITAGVFAGKLNLTSVTIGNNVKEIGVGAFKGCTNLAVIDFKDDAGAEELIIDEAAFAGCTGLAEMTLPTRLRIIGDDAFCLEYMLVRKIENLVIPEGVKEIGHRAFGGWNIKTFYLSSTVEKIGMIERSDDTFNNSKTYPVTVATEWYYDSGKSTALRNENTDIFYTPKAGISIIPPLLETITVATNNTKFGTFDNIFCVKDEDGNLSEILFSPLLNAGDEGVVDIPDTIKVIRDLAFSSNKQITELKFNGVCEFGSDIFRNAIKLKKMVLPGGLESISEGMFRGCSNIEEIIIPNTVKSIGLNAFNGCTNLSKLTFETGGEDPLDFAAGNVFETENGAPVTTIHTVFNGCQNLKELVLPERVEVINDYTFFNLTNLERITIPASVTKIGKYAFANCAALDEITFEGNNLKEIDNYAFGSRSVYSGSSSASYKVKLTNLVLPEGLEKIGTGAFNGCLSTSLSLPASLKTIGISAFSNMSMLSSVTFAKNSQLTTIGDSAFATLKLMEDWSSITNCTALTTIGASAFATGSMSTFTVPKSVVTLGASVFNNCKNLREIIFESDENGKSAISNIGNNCFQNSGLEEFTFPTTTADNLTLGTSIFNGCKQLTTVTLSDSITGIDGVFTLCYSVKTLIIPETNENLKTDPNAPLVLTVDASSGKATSIKLAYGAIPTDAAGTYRIPEGITEIGAGAFKNQKGIKKLILPSSLIIIGQNAFENCMSLETVTFDKPNEANLETICASAFKNCSSLINIDFGKNLKHIGYQSFTYCKKLGDITLPEDFTSLGYMAFSNSGITSVNLPSTLVYQAAVAVDQADKNSNSKYNGDQAFSGCSRLKSVTISSSWLGQGMFKESGLEEISIPSCVTTLYGNSTSYPIFGKCALLKKAEIDYKVTSATVGTYMFSEDPLLDDVTFGPNAKVAVNYMFYKCTALKSVDLTDITTLGTNLFQYCSSLTDVTFDSSISSLPNYTFQHCTSLESIDLTGITTLGTYLFSGCSSLNDVTLDSGITSLSNYMFQGCTSLESIDLPTGLTFMGTYTFQYSGLKSIEIPSGVTMLGTAATTCAATGSVYLFDCCANLETVTLPKGLTKIGGYVFRGCSSLTTVNYRDTDGSIVGKNGEVTFSSNLDLIGTYTFCGSGVIKVVIPESVTTVGTYLFGRSSSTVQVSMDSSNKVYLSCDNLESVELLASVTATPQNLFDSCSALTKVVLSSNITSFGNYIFRNCSSLKTVQLYDSSKAEGERIIGEENVVTLNSALTSMGTYTFQGSGIEEITLPVKITNLGTAATTTNYTFQNCASLRVINLHGSFTSIGASAFKGCTALEEVNILGADGNPTTSKLATVGNSAFDGCTELNTIDLSAVTTFGTYSFRNCESLEAVTLNESVTSISNYLFDGCTSLSDIDLSRITSFGNCSFRNTALTSISLDAVTSFGDNVFDTCEKLETVTLNDELTALAKSTFRQCYALTQITLPSKLTITGNYAFVGSGLTSIVIPASVKTIETYTFNNCKDLTSVTFEGGVTAINSGAFMGCSSLQSLTLPDTLTTIGNDCFLNCHDLTSLVIPASVTNVGINAFVGCGAAITIEESNEIYYAEESVILTKGNKLISIPDVITVEDWITEEGVVEIPYGVTGIAGYVFNGKNIKKVVLPETLISLDSYAFAYFAGDVDFSKATKLNGLPDHAFYGYKGESIVIPESITAIGNYAFQNCEALTSITVPEGVTELGAGVFKGCTSLTNVTLPSTLETVIGSKDDYVFEGCALGSIVFPAKVNTIKYCFKNCESLESITLSAGLTSSDNTFMSGCPEIKELIMPEGLAYVPYMANTKLTTLVIPSTVTTIYAGAFTDCTELTSVVIKEGVTSVAGSMFKNCTKLASVTLPSTLTSIGANAFEASGITELVIPSAVTSIGQKAFQHCEQLLTITHTTGSETMVTGYSSTSAGYGTFAFCTNLKSVKLGGNLAYGSSSLTAGLEAYMFEGCTSLETVVLEEGISKLNNGVFAGCTALKTINIPMGVTAIMANVFKDCASLKSITLPASMESLNNAFVGWTSEQEVIFEVYAYDGAANTTSWYGSDTNFSYRVVCINPVYAKTDESEA